MDRKMNLNDQSYGIHYERSVSTQTGSTAAIFEQLFNDRNDDDCSNNGDSPGFGSDQTVLAEDLQFKARTVSDRYKIFPVLRHAQILSSTAFTLKREAFLQQSIRSHASQSPQFYFSF
ncbi:unnamed protein product [Gongylonema pulchrum]|uniref:Uncharacterized protein n=1 Tax=Gongylonema pulchrum TaxID=637853 RepID=A0A183DFG8_9BILA|nr:unnamed protein product [Gongylonema pulchrum]